MRKAVLISASVVVLIASFAFATSASAVSQYLYWNGTIASGGHQDGPRHTITRNFVGVDTNNWRVCAGQLNSSGVWTGSYLCETDGSADKAYCQCALYYPRAHNGDSWSQAIGAWNWW